MTWNTLWIVFKYSYTSDWPCFSFWSHKMEEERFYLFIYKSCRPVAKILTRLLHSLIGTQECFPGKHLTITVRLFWDELFAAASILFQMDYLYSLKEITIVRWFDIAFVEVMSNFWYTLQETNTHDLQSRTKNAQSRKAAQSPEVLGPPGLPTGFTWRGWDVQMFPAIQRWKGNDFQQQLAYVGLSYHRYYTLVLGLSPAILELPKLYHYSLGNTDCKKLATSGKCTVQCLHPEWVS